LDEAKKFVYLCVIEVFNLTHSTEMVLLLTTKSQSVFDDRKVCFSFRFSGRLILNKIDPDLVSD
jgi:hypothetical protein